MVLYMKVQPHISTSAFVEQLVWRWMHAVARPSTRLKAKLTNLDSRVLLSIQLGLVKILSACLSLAHGAFQVSGMSCWLIWVFHEPKRRRDAPAAFGLVVHGGTHLIQSWVSWFHDISCAEFPKWLIFTVSHIFHSRVGYGRGDLWAIL